MSAGLNPPLFPPTLSPVPTNGVIGRADPEFGLNWPPTLNVGLTIPLLPTWSKFYSTFISGKKLKLIKFYTHSSTLHTPSCNYAECNYAECYDKCNYAEHYAECNYAEHYAECSYAECCNAEVNLWVPVKPFQPCLFFENKAGTHPSGAK